MQSVRLNHGALSVLALHSLQPSQTRIAMQVRSASLRLAWLDLDRLLSHQDSFLPGRFHPPTRVSPTPRAPERRLPGGRRELGCSTGEEDIRSHRDTLYRNSTNRTNYPARIPPGLRHHPTNRATPHSFLPPHHTANIARVIPILPLPVSHPRTTLLQIRRTGTTSRTTRTTPQRTHTQPITILSNPPTRISA